MSGEHHCRYRDEAHVLAEERDDWHEGRVTGIAPNGMSWMGYLVDRARELTGGTAVWPTGKGTR